MTEVQGDLVYLSDVCSLGLDSTQTCVQILDQLERYNNGPPPPPQDCNEDKTII